VSHDDDDDDDDDDDGCTCPSAPSDAKIREGDKDCPVHGLKALLDELDGLTLYKYPDGYKVFAINQVSADLMHLQSKRPQA